MSTTIRRRPTTSRASARAPTIAAWPSCGRTSPEAPSARARAQSLLTYFAGYTFTTPPASAPFGNLGRNAFRTPGLEQWDLGVDKNFRIREKIKIQFRSEFFNILNHTNFGVPNNISTSGAFGTITTTYPPRQIQFGLKLMF